MEATAEALVALLDEVDAPAEDLEDEGDGSPGLLLTAGEETLT